jgi:DNA-binding transcriptional ArsR family regulator
MNANHLPPLAAPTAAPGRAMLRTIGGGSGQPVETLFEVRTAFDFTVSLACEIGGTDELPPADRRWLEAARASLPAGMRQTIEDETFIFATALAVDHPGAVDAASFVDLLRETTGRDFTAAVFSDSQRDPAKREEISRALDGDADAIAAVAAAWPDPKHAWVDRLLRDPDAVLAEVTALMETWLPRYQEIEPRVRAILERDVELRNNDRARLKTPELIERTTNGIRWLSEPGVRRVILAPSYLVRPFNFTFAGGDWRMFVYPVADAALDIDDPLAPPQTVVRLHRALGDETRLRILRLLRDRDWYLTEIAERLELSKPTIKHHLAQLRAAGLVTLTEEGGLSYYSLRRDRLDDASGELKRYLIP